jgi:hypothetical protein
VELGLTTSLLERGALLTLKMHEDKLLSTLITTILYYLTPEDFLNGRIDERLKVRDEKLYQARLNRIEAKNPA